MKNLMEKGTRCLLVHPKFSSFGFWNYVEVCRIAGAKYPASPLGLMTVAALLPQQWDFKLVDENVEPLRTEHLQWADIVCIGGMLPQQKGMLSLIDRAHHHGLPVVLGGPDPSSQPHLYQSADYLVLGEGEVTIPLFLQDVAKGCGSGEYAVATRADMTNAVVPRFDLVRLQDYLQVGVQFSRGCPFHCEFCDVTELFGRQPRTKTAAQVVKELQALYDLGHRGHVDFVDDNFIGNKKHAREVLEAVKAWSMARDHPYFFSTESSLNVADDDGLLQLMKDVDLRYVFVGIETPDDEILKLTHKAINVNKPIVPAVRKISSYGMIVNAGFIIGFDNESASTADTMKQCIQDSGIPMAMVGRLYALPKTQLTQRLQREGRLFENPSILTDDIDQTTSGPNFRTMRPRVDVLRDHMNVLRHIYAPAQYYGRIRTTCLSLQPAGKYKPGVMKRIKMVRTFLKLCARIGLDKTTGWLYWKTLAIVGVRNPRAIESVVNLAAMYIHFQAHTRYIIEKASQEIDRLERMEQEKAVHGVHREGRTSADRKEPLLVERN